MPAERCWAMPRVSGAGAWLRYTCARSAIGAASPMPTDPFHSSCFSAFIKLVLGALFVVFWLKNRAAPWFGWWSVSRWFGLGHITSVLFMALGARPRLSHRRHGQRCPARFTSAGLAGGARSSIGECAVVEPGDPRAAFACGLLLAASRAHGEHPVLIVASSAFIADAASVGVRVPAGRGEHLPSRWPVIGDRRLARAVGSSVPA